MDRNPHVAGQFYPGDADTLNAELDAMMPQVAEPRPAPILHMVPHAGWIFSGRLCAQTLAAAPPFKRVVVMCPNHTGMGVPLSVWPEGRWNFPGGSMLLEHDLVEALIESEAGFECDPVAHLQEHSLEVIVPFLHRLDPDTSMAAICVAERDPAALERAGKALAEIIKRAGDPVGIIVSSDMSHMISADNAKQLDSLALEAVSALDPAALYATVRDNRISMCGVLPMTLGLHAALELGASRAELVGYTNSGAVTGDYDRVVGYAGVIVS